MTTRADLANAFDTARTDREIKALMWRVVSYRDASGDPTAQMVVDAISALWDARRAFDGAAGTWHALTESYRAQRAAIPPVHERAYIEAECWYARVRAMAERLMTLWAATGFGSQ